MAVSGTGRIYSLLKKIASSIGAESSTSSDSLVDIVNTLQTNVNSMKSIVSSLQSTMNTVNSNVGTVNSNVSKLKSSCASEKAATGGTFSGSKTISASGSGTLFLGIPIGSGFTFPTCIIDNSSYTLNHMYSFMVSYATTTLLHSCYKIPFSSNINITVSPSSASDTYYYVIVYN